MVTFRFAQLYFSAEEASVRADKTLESLERSLDRIIHNLPDTAD